MTPTTTRSRRVRKPGRRQTPTRPRAVVLTLEGLEARVVPTGTWTALNNLAPSPTGIGTMMLLSDGTVMAQGGNVDKTWYKLTPDATGSYANGAWSARASMSVQRLYFGSNVLTDGRVFVVGGEYSSDGGFSRTGEIYNPVTNSWSFVANFPQSQFGDDPTEVLPDGSVLGGYVVGPQTYIYHPTTNTWTQTGTKLRNDQSDEESWLKLPDNSILSYDVFSSINTGVGHAQRYVPSTGTWVTTPDVPGPLLTSTGVGYEMGPNLLLPDGRVFQIGANNHTAFYNPATNSWTTGPDIPNNGFGQQQGADDAPAAVLPNGKVLMAVDHPLFNGPTNIYEFDPATNTYTNVTPPANVIGEGGPSYINRMLVLPTGQVLLTNSGTRLALYTPDGSANAAWKPTVSAVTPNADGTYTLTGTQLNGISEGANYGDDAEMSSNYPLVRITDASGKVSYARTFNWDNTGVATGSTVETVKFAVPAGVDINSATLAVVANGIASNPFQLALNVTGTVPSGSTAGSLSTIRVLFNQPAQPATFTPDQAVLKGPGGTAIPVTVAVVAGSNNQQYDLNFATQTTLGKYSLQVGPNIKDANGKPMSQPFTTTLALNGPQVTASAAFVDHVRLTFNEPIDPNTLTPDQAVAFTGPSGAIDLSDATLTAVAGSNNTQVDVTFDPQSAFGNYELVVGPAISDTFGHQMDQNGNFIAGEVPGDEYHAKWTILQPKIVADSGIVHGASYLPGALDTVQEKVTFNEQMDPTTFTPDQVVISGQNGAPYQATSVTPVAGSNNTSFLISFTADATDKYTMTIGPNIQDIFGNAATPYSAITFNVLGPKVVSETGINPGSSSLPGTLSTMTVTFNEPMSPTSFTPDQVVFSAGTSYTADTVTAVAGSNNTQFKITFAATTTGKFTMALGPNVQDAFGNAMDQNGNFVTGEVPGDQFTVPFNVLGPRVFSAQVLGDFTNNVYNDVRLFFNEPMDPTTFTTDQFTLKGPGGVVIPVTGATAAAGSNNTVFDVSFAGQGKIGNYSLTVGPNLLDAFGNAMDQNGNLITGEVPGDQFNFAFSVAGPRINSATALPSSGLEPYNSVRVFFSKPIDVTTFTAGKVAGFQGPNGPISIDGIFPVPGTNDTQFDIDFKAQVATGKYTMTLGPDVRDLSGNKMDQNGNLIDGEVPGDQFTTSFTLAGLRVTTPTSGGNSLPGLDHVRLTFTAPIKGQFFTPSLVTVTGPNGPVTVNSITAVPLTDSTQFDVNFDPLNTTGAYTLVVKPTVQDVNGNLLDQNGNGIPGEDPGDRFNYSFGISGPRVLSSDPSSGTAPPVNHVRFTFNEAIDPNSFTTAQVVSFTGPNGAIAVTGVTPVDDTDTVYDVTFAQQSALGAYKMVLSEQIQDFYGNQMDQNNNLITGENPGDRYTAQFSVTLLTNPGFETGDFTGWKTTGAASIQTSAFGTGPTEGKYDALITNDGGPSHTAVESFLGLGSNALASLVSNVTNGSAIEQTIGVAAGTKLTFDWNFLTSEAVNDTFYRDFSFVSITPVGSGGTLQKLADTTSSLVVAPFTTGFGHMTGFKTFSYTFPTAGTYVIGVGAMNAGDQTVNSAILVDNFQLTPPGPAADQPGPAAVPQPIQPFLGAHAQRGPAGLAPASPDGGGDTVVIQWQGQTRLAHAGKWIMHLDGLPGTTRQVQLQAAQALLSAGGVTPAVEATDHLGSDGNVLLGVPADMTYYQLLGAVQGLPGFGYVEPYFADDGGQRTVFWTDDNDIVQQGGGAGAPAGPAAPTPPAGPSNVKILNGFEGINFSQSGGWTPPDTDGVVGPSSFIQNVNSSLAIYNKATGAAIAGPTGVNAFWAPEGESAFYSDPVAVYDEFTQKFVVVEGNFNNNHVFVAVSKTSNPTTLSTSDWNFYKYTLNDGSGASMDYPKIGYNQDGYVISYNMFFFNYDHSTTLSIRKSDMAGFVNVVPGGFSHFTLAPASMHSSNPGDPMWFVEDGHTGSGGSTVNVVKMTNPFSNSPTFTTTPLAVTPYGNAPNPRQPGGDLGFRTSLGTRFFFAGLRQVGNQTLLVSADAVGANGGSQARWYEFDVAPATPKLVQQGAIDQGAGVDTFYPDVDIAPGGLLGLTFDQSSATAPSGYLSMYVTGRNAGDPSGTLQTPVLARQGIGFLNAGGRGGDYSFTSIDPVDGTFWATNEYAPQNLGSNWNWATYVTHFSVAPPAGPSVIAQTPAVSAAGQVSSVRLTFDESIDPTTFTPAKVVSFKGPDGAAITVTGVTAVAGSNNTQFDVAFAAQTTLGFYTMVVGSDIRDTAGHQMDQNHNGTPGEVPGDQYTAKFSVQGLQVTASTPTGSMLPTNVDHVRLTFNEPVDPTSFTPDRLVGFTGPAGAIDLSTVTIAPVAGSNNTQFDVKFTPQSATGAYDLTVGPAIKDTFGHQMDQNGNFIDGEVPGDQYDAKWTLLGPKVVSETGITPNFSYQPGALTTVTVTFNEPMDPTTFTPGQVVISNASGSVTYTADAVTPVAGSNNTSFKISFTATITGKYTLAIGPNVLDAFGNAMDQNGNLITGEVPGDQYTVTFNVLGPKVSFGQLIGDFTNQSFTDVRLTFTESMDPSTFTADQFAFTGPGGVKVPVTVTPVANTVNSVFDVAFAPQGKIGSYKLVVGPNLLDTYGNAMDQNGNAIPGEVPGDQYTLTFSVAGPKVLAAVALPSGGNEAVNTLRVIFSKPMDVATFTPAKIASFAGPNGPISIDGIFAVPFTNFTQFDIDFKAQAATGKYTLVLGPDVRDLSGNQMDQNGNGIAGEVPADQFTAVFNLAGLRITTPSSGGNSLPGLDHVRLTFTAPVNPLTFTADTVLSFTGPGGAIPVKAVTAVPYSDYTQYDVSFDPLGTTGSYTLVVAPTLQDLYGNSLDQNNNGVPGEDPGDRFTYNFGISGPRVLSSTPTGTIQGSVDHVRFTFNEAIDPSTFTPAQVVSFTGPNGAVAVTGVSPVDASDTAFDVTFAPQSALGSYTMVLSEQIQDFYGNQMDQNNNLITGESPGDRYTAQFTIALLKNPGFEDNGGSLTGWTVQNLGPYGNWFVQSGTFSPQSGFQVPAPPGPTHAAMTDSVGYGSHVLYQDFVVPNSVSTASLSFDLFIGNRNGAFYTPNSLDPNVFPNQQARVDIITTTANPFSVAAGDVLLNLYQTHVGDPAVSGYTAYTTDLTAFLSAHKGQTVRLRFAEVDNQLYFQFGVDLVNLVIKTGPSAPGTGGAAPQVADGGAGLPAAIAPPVLDVGAIDRFFIATGPGSVAPLTGSGGAAGGTAEAGVSNRGPAGGGAQGGLPTVFGPARVAPARGAAQQPEVLGPSDGLWPSWLGARPTSAEQAATPPARAAGAGPLVDFLFTGDHLAQGAGGGVTGGRIGAGLPEYSPDLGGVLSADWLSDLDREALTNGSGAA